MKISVVILFLILMVPITMAQTPLLEKGEEIEGTYNIKTFVTKDNAYIVLDTEKPGDCEYSLGDFQYGQGNKFEKINETIHQAKISIDEGMSYRFKIKCIVEGKRGEENILLSVSRISFFLIENLDELKNNLPRFKEEMYGYGGKIDVNDLNQEIKELEEIVEGANNCIESNDIEGLRLAISEGIRKRNEIENRLMIKSIQLYILDSSRYVIASIILIYLLIYLTSSFFIPYERIKDNLKRLGKKEGELVNLRKNTEMLYFHRRIDEETFNKMLIKEQEEVIRVRTKISRIKKQEEELVRKLFEPSTVIEWSLRESIHIRDVIKNISAKIKDLKNKTNNI